MPDDFGISPRLEKLSEKIYKKRDLFATLINKQLHAYTIVLRYMSWSGGQKKLSTKIILYIPLAI